METSNKTAGYYLLSEYLSDEFGMHKNNNRHSTPNSQHFGIDTRLTVILDLDQTLVSSTVYNKGSINCCDFMISVSCQGKPVQIAVNERPNLNLFLRELSKFATLILYSAATKDYVDEILPQIDPMQRYFSKVYTRENCIKDASGRLKKDYSIIKSHPAQTLIVDDIQENFSDFKENGILIPPYKGEIEDDDLVRVLEIILALSQLPDVRMRSTFSI